MVAKRRKRPQGRPQGGSEPIVRSVMAATLKQLGDRGLEGICIEEIASAVGLNKTSIYRRWPSRRDLVLAALLARREDTPPFVESGDLTADLVRALSEKVAHMSTPLGRRITQVLMAFNDPDAVAITRGLRLNRYSCPSAIIKNAVARGELPAGTDPDILGELLQAPVLYRVLVWGEPVDEAYIRRVVETALRSARPAPAAAAGPRRARLSAASGRGPVPLRARARRSSQRAR
jgi:AcrR family transcriptional regulator